MSVLDPTDVLIAGKPVNWRKSDLVQDADTDVELDKTPQDVIDGLGFDPKEFGAGQ